MKNVFIRTFFLSILVSIAFSLGAQSIVVSISDFNVESENKKFTYLGKGISTLVAGELRRTKAIKILERSQMNKIMEEQKLSLSGMVDEADQVELGKLLAADYIIFGEIIDMGNSLLISVRMADVTTAEVVWEDSLMEKLETYDYIGAYFAKSILTELDLNVEKETIAKVETKAVKETEAIVALSSGIDAYDKGDEEKAKEELKAVQKLDPGNEAARFYLEKLVSISPKFQVVTASYITAESAASLANIDSMEINSWVGTHSIPFWMETTDSGAIQIDTADVKDMVTISYFGVSVPVKEKLGIGGGYYSGGTDLQTWDSTNPIVFQSIPADGMKQYMMIYGGYLSAGYKVTDWLSIGASLMMFYADNPQDESDVFSPSDNNIVKEGVYWGFNPGVLITPPGSKFVLDFDIGYSNQHQYYIDAENGTLGSGSQPLALEASMVYGPFLDRIFAGLSLGSDVYLDDRGGYTLRTTPMVEFWPSEFLSLRGGYTYSYLSQMDEFSGGHGFIFGTTVKMGRFELSGNVTYRHIPVTLLPGVALEDLAFLIGIKYNSNSLRRE